MEGQVEGVRKENNEVEERARKSLKEKVEIEIMAQMTIQKLYKEMPEVLIIVEVIMEEHILNIGKVIKGFRSKIENLYL